MIKSMTLTQIGFKVSITINCETEEEIIAHLTTIRKEAKKHLKVGKGGVPDGLDLQWDDNNCYGTHDVVIEPEFA